MVGLRREIFLRPIGGPILAHRYSHSLVELACRPLAPGPVLSEPRRQGPVPYENDDTTGKRSAVERRRLRSDSGARLGVLRPNNELSHSNPMNDRPRPLYPALHWQCLELGALARLNVVEQVQQQGVVRKSAFCYAAQHPAISGICNGPLSPVDPYGARQASNL